MKTTAHKSFRFPRGYQMIIYLLLVAAIGFLNCLVMNAAEPEKKEKVKGTNINIEELTRVDAEPELRLEDWMFGFNIGLVAEEAVELEEWMFNFNETYITEEEIELESWMLSFGEAYTAEDDVKPEDWMLHFEETFITEESIEMEDWMFDFGYNSDPFFYAEK